MMLLTAAWNTIKKCGRVRPHMARPRPNIGRPTQSDFISETRHQQTTQTHGELSVQGGTKKTVPAIWISDDVRKTLLVAQKTLRIQQTGNRVNRRLEFKRRERKVLRGVPNCLAGGLGVWHPQPIKSQRGVLWEGRRGGRRAVHLAWNVVQGGGWAGRQKEHQACSPCSGGKEGRRK